MGACTEATLAPHAATAAHRQPLTEPRRRHRPSLAGGPVDEELAVVDTVTVVIP